MVNHRGLYPHDFWAPPGGGVDFGLSAQENLEREFLEETGLIIQAGEFQFGCELIQTPLHAIELFFEVAAGVGKPKVGTDPEMGKNEQIIQEVKFLSEREIWNLPETHRHGLFKLVKSLDKIRTLKGYLKI
jgi:8-oxo-dGTP diphosphatase